MSSTLFRIDKRNNVILDKNAAKLTKYCRKLTEEQLRFVILVCDYHSPLKQYPKKERIQKAKRMVWIKDESANFFPEEDKTIAEAMVEYGDLQYDPIRETIAKYNEKIESLSQELLISTKAGSIKSLDGDIGILQERVRIMQEEVDRIDETVKLKRKDDSLSLIEIWQDNQKKAHKDRAAIEKKLEDRRKKDGQVQSED